MRSCPICGNDLTVREGAMILAALLFTAQHTTTSQPELRAIASKIEKHLSNETMHFEGSV